MAKEELVEGIKLAVAKGSTLREAMMSFYNSGYSREDIEEAARAIQIPQFSQLTGTPEGLKPLPRAGTAQGKPKITPSVHPTQQAPQKPAAQSNSQRYQALTPNSTQKVSNYDFNKKKKKNIVVIVIIMILLVVALALIFLFRSQLTTLFHNLIG